jgi:hypothetical protein
MFRFFLILAIATQLALAQSPAVRTDAVPKEIEALYAKGLEATRLAKSIEDLDEIDRTFNTRDWQSITPGQSTRGWPDIRKFGFEGQVGDFKSTEMLIDTFRVDGDIAVVIGRLRTVNRKGNVGYIPLKETWKRTIIGWKRQTHQKFAPGVSLPRHARNALGQGVFPACAAGA